MMAASVHVESRDLPAAFNGKSGDVDGRVEFERHLGFEDLPAIDGAPSAYSWPSSGHLLFKGMARADAKIEDPASPAQPCMRARPHCSATTWRTGSVCAIAKLFLPLASSDHSSAPRRPALWRVAQSLEWVAVPRRLPCADLGADSTLSPRFDDCLTV